MSRVYVLLALVLAGSLGCGSGATQGYRVEDYKERVAANPTLVVMAPDVQVFEKTAGGVLEPKADWTEQAEKHVTTALVGELRARNLQLVAYEPHPEGSAREHEDLQILKLHAAVMKSILWHHYIVEGRLPSKKGRFEWTLGPGVARLRAAKKADYVLLVVMRDSYASGGRATLVALSSIFSPLTGTRASGGEQTGFASLIDLSTGDVLWCNALYREAGDLRTAEPAKTAVQYLLEGLPL